MASGIAKALESLPILPWRDIPSGCPLGGTLPGLSVSLRASFPTHIAAAHQARRCALCSSPAWWLSLPHPTTRPPQSHGGAPSGAAERSVSHQAVSQCGLRPRPDGQSRWTGGWGRDGDPHRGLWRPGLLEKPCLSFHKEAVSSFCLVLCRAAGWLGTGTEGQTLRRAVCSLISEATGFRLSPLPPEEGPRLQQGESCFSGLFFAYIPTDPGALMHTHPAGAGAPQVMILWRAREGKVYLQKSPSIPDIFNDPLFREASLLPCFMEIHQWNEG